MDNTIGGNNVLLQHHLDSIDSQAVAITADLYGAALGSLVHWPCHDCFGTLDTVQQVVFHQGCVGGSECERDKEWETEEVADHTAQFIDFVGCL